MTNTLITSNPASLTAGASVAPAELPVEAPVQAAVSAAPTPSSMAVRIWNDWLFCHPVILLTAVGAVMRLFWLDAPPIWGDEAATYARTSGSFRDMLQSLQGAGFMPLHYEIYWLMGQYFSRTPTIMRMIPALCGIAAIPAMYFLAIRLVNRRAALLATTFLTFSAWMLNYSRDAKMYMDFWLMCILSVGCFLWWMHDGRRVAWLAWLASALAMVGLHAPGMILLFLPPLIALTWGIPDWRKLLLMLIGLAIATAGPVVYYLDYSQLINRSERADLDAAAGLVWVPNYNTGRTGPDHLLYAASTFLFCWEWPSRLHQIPDPDVLPNREAVVVLLLGFAALGLMPWPRRWQADGVAAPSIDGDPSASATTASPTPAPPHWVRPWQRRLWLTLWLVLPAYGMYCKSVAGFASPRDWLSNVGDLAGGHWALWIGLMVLLAGLCAWWRPLARLLVGALVIATAGSLCVVVLQKGPAPTWNVAEYVRTWAMQWPSVLEPWFALMISPLAIALFVTALAPAAWHLSAATLRGRLAAAMPTALIVGITLELCWTIFAVMPKENTGSIWVPRYLGVVWPALAIALACLFLRLPTRPLRWAAIGVFLAINLFVAQQRIFEGTEPPVDVMAADVMASDAWHQTPLRTDIGFRRDDDDRQWTIRWQARGDDLGQQHTRVYAGNARGGIGPGMGDLLGLVGKYYLAIATGTPMSPRLFEGPFPLVELNTVTSADMIADDVANNPKLTRLIVWDHTNQELLDRPDAILRALGESWQLVSKQQFIARDHWIWQTSGVYRRREYVKRQR